jgi:hypothetical protein
VTSFEVHRIFIGGGLSELSWVFVESFFCFLFMVAVAGCCCFLFVFGLGPIFSGLVGAEAHYIIAASLFVL